VYSDPQSDPPAWERLIDRTLSTHERISLIVSIFSDPNEVEVAGHLSGDDAQTFIDVIDEVSPHTPSPPKAIGGPALKLPHRSGVGQSSAADLQEVFAIFV
jgi:hypothetical protein